MQNLLKFDIGEEYPCKSIGELKEEFYRSLRMAVKGRPHKIEIAKPIAFILNPPMLQDSADPLAPDKYIVLYYRGYYIRIECGRSVMHGPHKFELLYQVRRGHHVRLGCFTAEFPFHVEAEVKKKIHHAIVWKAFYATDATNDLVIELRPEGEEDTTL